MDFRYRFFDTLSSTNDEARKDVYSHGDVIVARTQTAGRGQRGSTWSGEQDSSLMLSMVLEPSFLEAGRQFQLLQCVALSVADMFESYGLDPRIKWTNDIYIGDRKIVGILIEQSLRGGFIGRCVAGIGINVNQRRFEEWIPNPTSMALETGATYDLRQVLERLCEALDVRYEQLRAGRYETLSADYGKIMYRIGRLSHFVLPDGKTVCGTVRGVKPAGELVVEFEDGSCGAFLFGDIRFVI